MIMKEGVEHGMEDQARQLCDRIRSIGLDKLQQEYEQRRNHMRRKSCGKYEQEIREPLAKIMHFKNGGGRQQRASNIMRMLGYLYYTNKGSRWRMFVENYKRKHRLTKRQTVRRGSRTKNSSPKQSTDEERCMDDSVNNVHGTPEICRESDSLENDLSIPSEIEHQNNQSLLLPSQSFIERNNGNMSGSHEGYDFIDDQNASNFPIDLQSTWNNDENKNDGMCYTSESCVLQDTSMNMPSTLPPFGNQLFEPDPNSFPPSNFDLSELNM